MTKRKFRFDLIQKYGGEKKAEAAATAYREEHQLTSEQMNSGEWVTIRQLKDECDKVGITNSGANSTMVRSIGWDRALCKPWDPSLTTYYGRGMRWFRKSSLADGIKAMQAGLQS